MHLQLMGQPVPHAPLEIPDKLSNIITIHEKLPYPEYYRLLSNAVRPTFTSPGPGQPVRRYVVMGMDVDMDTAPTCKEG
jgi:hypothetical protein